MPSSTVYTANLAAMSTSANLFAGDINEFVNQLSQINIYAVASAVGMKVTVLADADVAIDDKEITAIGTSLNKSDHLFDSFMVYPGTRLAVKLHETANVATTDTYVAIEVIPIASRR